MFIRDDSVPLSIKVRCGMVSIHCMLPLTAACPEYGFFSYTYLEFKLLSDALGEVISFCWWFIQNEIEQNIEDRSVPVTTRPMRDGKVLYRYANLLSIIKFDMLEWNHLFGRSSFCCFIIIINTLLHRWGEWRSIQLYLDGDLRVSDWSRCVFTLGQLWRLLLRRAHAVVEGHRGKECPAKCSDSVIGLC